ncbi:MAG TPA: ABC transporter permease subunit [Gaiellaceae bacterium]|nr:ABC transporter permease subunit [Gaiellaceae bacterium]
MAWVTWRQHRSQLVAAVGLLVALAAAAFGTHLPIRAAYHRGALADCLPPAARSGCDIIVRHFESEFNGWAAAVRGLAVLPVLAGLFVGAPLLARELEHGTHRFAWTQGVTRRRWLLSKTTLLAAVTLAAGGVVSALVMWWRSPFDTLEGRIAPSGFDIEGVVVPAYALFALAVGVLAGLVFRRTVAAMTATLVVFAATRVLVLNFVRPHFLSPLHRIVVATDSSPQAGDWILSDTLVDAGGRQITAGREDLAVLHAQQAGIDPHTYLVTLGWKRIISYQPAARFWTFQLIEAGLFVALAAAVVLATIWLVRRTPT